MSEVSLWDVPACIHGNCNEFVPMSKQEGFVILQARGCPHCQRVATDQLVQEGYPLTSFFSTALARAADACAATAEERWHEVRENDTSGAIARLHGVSEEALVASNMGRLGRVMEGRRQSLHLFVGDRVRIPSRSSLGYIYKATDDHATLYSQLKTEIIKRAVPVGDINGKFWPAINDKPAVLDAVTNFASQWVPSFSEKYPDDLWPSLLEKVARSALGFYAFLINRVGTSSPDTFAEQNGRLDAVRTPWTAPLWDFFRKWFASMKRLSWQSLAIVLEKDDNRLWGDGVLSTAKPTVTKQYYPEIAWADIDWMDPKAGVVLVQRTSGNYKTLYQTGVRWSQIPWTSPMEVVPWGSLPWDVANAPPESVLQSVGVLANLEKAILQLRPCGAGAMRNQNGICKSGPTGGAGLEEGGFPGGGGALEPCSPGYKRDPITGFCVVDETSSHWQAPSGEEKPSPCGPGEVLVNGKCLKKTVPIGPSVPGGGGGFYHPITPTVPVLDVDQQEPSGGGGGGSGGGGGAGGGIVTVCRPGMKKVGGICVPETDFGHGGGGAGQETEGGAGGGTGTGTGGETGGGTGGETGGGTGGETGGGTGGETGGGTGGETGGGTGGETGGGTGTGTGGGTGGETGGGTGTGGETGGGTGTGGETGGGTGTGTGGETGDGTGTGTGTGDTTSGQEPPLPRKKSSSGLVIAAVVAAVGIGVGAMMMED